MTRTHAFRFSSIALFTSALLTSACGPAPATSQQTAALAEAITSVKTMRVQSTNPHAFITQLAGGGDSTAAMNGTDTFEPMPGLVCVRVLDKDTTAGSEHVASCNDGSFTLGVTIANADGRVRVDAHSEGELPSTPGWHAKMTQTFDLATSPSLIDGKLDEHITADNSLQGEHVERRSTMAFDHVLLDGSDCPVSGTASIDRDDSGTGISNFREHLGADFLVGPRCGDLRVSLER